MEADIPESPEVRKITQSLAADISGQVLISAKILSGRYVKKLPSDWQELEVRLPIKVIGAGVHGKFCYWLCSNETFIYSHVIAANGFQVHL